MEKSEKGNVLMLMCEKRVHTKLVKFIRCLDLAKLTDSENPIQSKLREDVIMNG